MTILLRPKLTDTEILDWLIEHNAALSTFTEFGLSDKGSGCCSSSITPPGKDVRECVKLAIEQEQASNKKG